MKSAQRLLLAVENCVSLHFVLKNFILPNDKNTFLNNSFCMKSVQRIQLAVEICCSSFCVKNFLAPNYKVIFLKKALCIKSAERIELTVENSVSLYFVLKTSFCQIIRISCQKICFASILLKEYNSLLKTEFHFILC